MRLLFVLCCVLLTLPQPARADNACPRCAPLGIVFVINGSNLDYELSDGMRLAVAHQKYPIQVETIPWIRNIRATWNHMDTESQLQGAANLAAQVQAYHTQCPAGHVYLVAHSTGTHVALVAAATLPHNSVDRIVLLAPSVSHNYDLRPALRASREGILHFYSTQDNVVSLGAEVLGTADQRWTKPAGEVGFTPPPPNCADANLYQKLRQYYWHPELCRYGHTGGHFGFTRANYLDAVVIPAMLGGRPMPILSNGPVYYP